MADRTPALVKVRRVLRDDDQIQSELEALDGFDRFFREAASDKQSPQLCLSFGLRQIRRAELLRELMFPQRG